MITVVEFVELIRGLHIINRLISSVYKPAMCKQIIGDRQLGTSRGSQLSELIRFPKLAC